MKFVAKNPKISLTLNSEKPIAESGGIFYTAGNRINTAITKMIKEFVPLDNEGVLKEIKGNAWSDDPNPIMRFIMFFVKIISFILGIRRRTHLIISNLRIVQVDKSYLLWILPVGMDVTSFNKSSIQSVGYRMRSSWLIFRKYYLVLANANSAGKKLMLTYRDGKKSLIETCNIIETVIAQK